MHEDDKAHWSASVNPQVQEKDRELLDRCVHGEIMAEDELTTTPEAPPLVTEKEIRKRCGLSEGEWNHIRHLRVFRNRYIVCAGYWSPFAPLVIDQARSVLLRDFKTAADVRRAKDAVRAPRQYSAEQRAAVSAGLRESWKRRKAQGGKQSD